MRCLPFVGRAFRCAATELVELRVCLPHDLMFLLAVHLLLATEVCRKWPLSILKKPVLDLGNP